MHVPDAMLILLFFPSQFYVLLLNLCVNLSSTKAKIAKLAPFQDYVREVLSFCLDSRRSQGGWNFKDIDEIVARYDTLQATHLELTKREQVNQDKIHQLKVHTVLCARYL